MSWDLGWQHPSSVAIGHAGEPRAEGTEVPNSEDKDADNSNSPRPAHRFLRQEVGRVCPSGKLRYKDKCDKGKGKPTPPTAKGGVKGKKPPFTGSDAGSTKGGKGNGGEGSPIGWQSVYSCRHEPHASHQEYIRRSGVTPPNLAQQSKGKSMEPGALPGPTARGWEPAASSSSQDNGAGKPILTAGGGTFDPTVPPPTSVGAGPM